MYEALLHALSHLNGFLTAGIAITAFSLLLYALSFNLRDRVARSFALILLCVVFVFVGEAISSMEQAPIGLEFWMRLEWVGILYLPAAYLHLSDAILATTGKPSRGRRRRAVRLTYLLSTAFLLLLPPICWLDRWFRNASGASSTAHSPHLDFQRLIRRSDADRLGEFPPRLPAHGHQRQPPPHGLPVCRRAGASVRLLPLPAVWLWHRRSLSAVVLDHFNHQQHPDFLRCWY